MVEEKVFLTKPNHQNHLSKWRECDYSAQWWKERRLLCKSMFIPIKRWTAIPKMVEIEVSLLKPKHQYHLSQWGECVDGAQSWKEKRLLCEFMFIPIERWTSVLKMVEIEVSVLKSKH